MDRTEYTDCMRPYMAGPKESGQRKLDFCLGAKLCSGKASSPEEALVLCSQPKPEGEEPKPGKSRKKKHNPRELAVCLLEHIGGEELTLAILVAGIATCQEFKKPYGEKQYVKDCIKADAIPGEPMEEIAKRYKLCKKEWRKKNESEAVIQ